MKKLICLLLIVVVLATMLTACGSFTCDFCGEEGSGSGNTIKVLGEEGVLCDDCYDEWNSASSALGGLF